LNICVWSIYDKHDMMIVRGIPVRHSRGPPFPRSA